MQDMNWMADDRWGQNCLDLPTGCLGDRYEDHPVSIFQGGRVAIKGVGRQDSPVLMPEPKIEAFKQVHTMIERMEPS